MAASSRRAATSAVGARSSHWFSRYDMPLTASSRRYTSPRQLPAPPVHNQHVTLCQHLSLIPLSLSLIPCITALTLATHTDTHTHTFNGPFSATTRVSRYQKGNTNLDFTEARDSEWQWHQLGTCKSAPRSRQIPCQHLTTQFFKGRMPFLQPNQQRQSTEGTIEI